MRIVLNWPTVTTYASGTLTPDGNTYNDTATNGCVAKVWRE